MSGKAKNKRSKLLPVIPAALAVGLLSACGGGAGAGDVAGQQGEAAKPEKKEPVTLHFLYNGYSKELVEEQKSKVEKKFPHIMLNVMLEAGEGTKLQDVIGSGTQLDAVARAAGGVFDAMKYQVMTDLTPFIQSHKFDTNRLAPGILEAVKSYSSKGEVLFMPYELNNTTLYYNKSIFDRFGLPYPTDGMTWDDVYDLASKVTREDGGVKYKGIKLNALNLVYRNQLGLPFVDPQTFEPKINTDAWKGWLETMTRLYTIPGNEPASDDTANFFSKQTLAMMAGPSPLDQLPAAVQKGLDWDVVSLPQFKGMEGKGSQMNAPFYAITPTSKHKDDVFEVLAYLVSDEIQSWNSRMGHVSVLRDASIMAEFGQGLDILKGKNIKAFVSEKIAAPVQTTIYDGIARSRFSQIVDRLVSGSDDVNTALRKAEEDILKRIADEKK